MRTWTLHPKHLITPTNQKNYVSNWSETLQGLGAIQGKHKMHKNHPQLNRFKALKDKCEVGLYTYLNHCYLDSQQRLTIKGNKFKFDYNKIDKSKVDMSLRLPVSTKQVMFELEHLNMKFRDRGLKEIKFSDIELHDMFYIDDSHVDNIEKGQR